MPDSLKHFLVFNRASAESCGRIIISMNKAGIKIAPYAPLLIYQKGYTPEFVAKTLKEHRLQGLRIFAILKDDRLESLDFLKEYKFLTTLHIDLADDLDYTVLKELTDLKDLAIGGVGKQPIDLSQQTNLEKLSIRWRKKIYGIEACKKVHSLSLYGYNEMDLSAFRHMTLMKRLVVNASSIQSLDGIEGMDTLEEMAFGSCKKLVNIQAINGKKALIKLDFESCPVIGDLSSLDNLPALEFLRFTDCKQIKSISFIDKLPSLRKLVFLGNTDIVDGDMGPARRIKELFYKHLKHYNFKVDTPEADRISKENLNKISQLSKNKSQ